MKLIQTIYSSENKLQGPFPDINQALTRWSATRKTEKRSVRFLIVMIARVIVFRSGDVVVGSRWRVQTNPSTAILEGLR